MDVLRARGRNIVAATREDAQAGERISDRFAKAALPSEDEEESGKEEESERDEDGDDEDFDDFSGPDGDSSNGGFSDFSSDSSEDGDSEERSDEDLDGSFSAEDFEVPYVTSDDGSSYAQRMSSFHDPWDLSSSSSSSEEGKHDSDCLRECDTMSRKSFPSKSASQDACAEFFSERILINEPVCCALYSLQVSDSEDEIMNSDIDDAPMYSAPRRNFWNRPLVTAGRNRTLPCAEGSTLRPLTRAVPPRTVFACSPTTPQEASDEDLHDTGSVLSRRTIEFTAPRGACFFNDEPSHATGRHRRFPVPFGNSSSPRPTNDSPGRGCVRGPGSQSRASRVSAARSGASTAGSAAPPAAGSSSAVPRTHDALTVRPRLRRITAPDPESSDSGDSECRLGEMRRVRPRLRTAALENGTSRNSHLATAAVRRRAITARERARVSQVVEVRRPSSTENRRSIFFDDEDREQDRTVAPGTPVHRDRQLREEQSEELDRLIDDIYQEDEIRRRDRTFGVFGNRNHAGEVHQSLRDLGFDRHCAILRSVEREERVRRREADDITEARTMERRREGIRGGGPGSTNGAASEVNLTQAREFVANERSHEDETGRLEFEVDGDNGEESSEYELEDDFDSDDMVLHRYYLSNALSALHGGADDDELYVEGLENEDDNSDSDEEDEDFDAGDYMSDAAPQSRYASRLRESSFLSRLYGSDFDEDTFNDNSITYPTSPDGSENGSDIANGDMSDNNDNNTGGDVHLARQISHLESRFMRAQRRMARNRQQIQEIQANLNAVSDALENAGQVMEDGDEYMSDGLSGSDWIPGHGQWVGPAARRFDFRAPFRDDDEDDVVFFGETRTTAEMERIAPGHVAAPNLRSTICVICTEELGTAEVRTLPCAKHRYHKACIDSWCQQNATCPTCRAELKLPAPGSPRPGGTTSGEPSQFSVAVGRRRLSARRSRRNQGGYSSA